MRHLPLALLLVALISLSACGGGPGSSVTGVGAEFAAKALAVCAHARQLKDAQGQFPIPGFNPTKPDPAAFPVVAAFLAKTAATFGTWLAEMQALGQPPTAQTEWAVLVSAVQRHVDLNAEQIVAAQGGDVATFAADYERGMKTQSDLLKAATDAGVADCAKVDR